MIASDPFVYVSKTGKSAVNILSGTSLTLNDKEYNAINQLQNGKRISIDSTVISLLSKKLVQLKTSEQETSINSRIKHYLSSIGSLCIMPTEKCNFRCTYCYEKFLKGKMSDTITNSVIKFLSKNLKKFETYNLGFFGGEPLLHPDLILLISQHYRQLQAQYGVGGTIGITTNGYQLNSDILKNLESIKIDIYHISIDGPKKIHDSQRKLANGRGTYDKILENIELILNTTKSNIIFRINYSAKENTKNETIKWLESEILTKFEKFKKRIQYSVVSVWDATTQAVEGICIKDLQTFQSYHQIQKTISKYLGYDNSLDWILDEIRSIGSLSCYAGKPNHYIIGSDGKIYKCTVAFDLSENNIGRIQKNGDLEIDSIKENLWVKNNSLTDTKCRGCGFAHNCMGINCPLTRIQSGKPPCPTEKKYLEEYLSEKIG